MTPRNPTNAPTSSQLERVREIIIGRQLGKVEQRLQRLEERTQVAVSDGTVSSSQERIEALEARFEAVRDAMQHQVDQIRFEFGGEMDHRKHEVRRLAEQIQQAAQAKLPPAVTVPDLAATENRLVAWVSAWQQSLEQHLVRRENWLIGQLREELYRAPRTAAPQSVPSHQAKLGQQLATAAQALGVAAQSLSQAASSFSSPQ
jgi:hypothetical protein